MKLRLLFFAAFLSLASCTSDDSTDPVNENPDPTPPVEKNIKRIEEYGFNGETESLYQVILCENNKIHQILGYIDPDPSVISGMEEYSYDSQGRLNSLTYNYYTIYGDDTFTSFEYDAQGRLTYMKADDEDSSINRIREYTYNIEDNVVTGDYDPGGTLPNIYYMNGNGIIYKTEYENEFYSSITEVNYQGNNIVSNTRISNSTNFNPYTINYTYDYETEVKGQYLNLYRNSFGSTNNMVLFRADFYLAALCTDNYILTESKANSTDVNTYYEYSFDEDGYPVEIRRISSGSDVYFQKTVIIYE
ncbi:hypothetical protein FUA48_11555 [Flavobacterium alkalisoli]|uniref:DUF4595 domain-containing protein n=1 Tax=Flavobacterium alkalisoli TaxID=2602769 RepID=A0A5B9FV65_9FLAO|nr:hypothetical protein [Flavobacterium alkalisoli]QEE50189.1 hypothetical protein FUA48_11555 [Flavobacterium alkalisoli]